MKAAATTKKKYNTTTRNARGIRVRKICASCQFRCIEDDGTRSCQRTNQPVDQCDRCKLWQMSQGTKNAGISRYGIKRREYLAFVLNVRFAEDEALKKGTLKEEDCKPVEELRRQFEETSGSIYVNGIEHH